VGAVGVTSRDVCVFSFVFVAVHSRLEEASLVEVLLVGPSQHVLLLLLDVLPLLL